MPEPEDNTFLPPTIFWSWQSDQSEKTCRHFIRDCLSNAIKEIAGSSLLDDAERPSLDHDTKGEPGMADITSTILAKITQSSIFVADLTPIGETEDQKYLPNPNVMIELGWAMHRPGWERVIGILNTAYGAQEEDLPFDIRQRRIITYDLDEETDKKTKKTKATKLTKELVSAININLGHQREKVVIAQVVKGVDAMTANPSIWATAKAELVHGDAFGYSATQKIGIPDVPRAYMRVIPAGWKKVPPAISVIRDLSHQKVEAPSDRATSGDWGATEEGFVRYWITDTHDTNLKQAANMTMFFEDTGEFWMLHGNAVINSQKPSLINHFMVLQNWSKMLRTSIDVLKLHGADKIISVEAGMFGIENTQLYDPWADQRPTSRRNQMVCNRQNTNWSNEAQISFLALSYNKLLNLFAKEPVTEAEITTFLAKNDRQRFTHQS